MCNICFVETWYLYCISSRLFAMSETGSGSNEGTVHRIYDGLLIDALTRSIALMSGDSWTRPSSGASTSPTSTSIEGYGNPQLLEQQGGCYVQICKGFRDTRQPEIEQGFAWQDGSGIHQAWRKAQDAVLDLLKSGFSVPYFDEIASHLIPVYRHPCEGCHLSIWGLDEYFWPLDAIMRNNSHNFQTPEEREIMTKWNSLQESMGELQVHVQQLRAESGLSKLPEDAVLRFVSSEQYPDGTSRACVISERGCLLQVDEDTVQLR